MQAEIITIGDEILLGQTIDTNSAFIATELQQIGILVFQITSVSDSALHITQSIREAEERSDLVIITGGLGPTSDDITKPTLCKYFDTHLVLNDLVLNDVRTFLELRKYELNTRNIKQAEVPANCTVLPNKVGTAPGLLFEKNHTIFIALPGVPHEVEHLVRQQIIPFLHKQFKLPLTKYRTILTTGIPESELAQRLELWQQNLPSVIKLAYLPSPGIVKLRIGMQSEDPDLLQYTLDKETQAIHKYIPDAVFGYDSDTMQSVIGKLLQERNVTISTAESCTGGHIAHLITSVSGSSQYFEGSVVAYSNQIKQTILGVSENKLQEFGAVSQAVVEEMAIGVRNLMKTDYSIATSGIAGPDGGTAEKPVGTVWIAVASKNNVVSQKFNFGNNRRRTTIHSSISALNMLRLMLLNKL